MMGTKKKKTRSGGRRRHILLCLAAAVFLASLTGCGRTVEGKTKIQVFVAASLHTVMQELGENFQKEHPDVEILWNADSSGKLLTQIREGYSCDLFFSAAQTQMDQLEADGLVKPKSRKDVLKNQLVVVAAKGSRTKVTGLSDLEKAESLALAGGSVPAGMYTRNALIKLGKLPETDDPAGITTKKVSEALGGVEISEQENVSKVLIAVAEGACEAGTTYYSDIYGYEDRVEVLEKADNALTEEVVYPVCLVENAEASNAQEQAAKLFWEYLTSDEAAELFKTYYFEPI